MKSVAAVQMASGPQVQANLMEANRLIRQAADEGAGLVVLPEVFGIMGLTDKDTVATAEPFGEGQMQDFISRKAKEYGVWIVAGTIPLLSDDPGKYSASSLLYNDQGEQVARYDKTHLFDVKVEEEDQVYTESNTVVPGTEAVVVDTPFGKLGMTVCYDLRFPELYRHLVRQGAEIITVPSAFTEATGMAHWEPLLRARAIENLCYIVAPAQGGYHVNGRTTWGHSMVIDYWGRIRGQLSKGAGITSMVIELDELHATRKNFPVLEHCCPAGTLSVYSQA
uniref:FIG003879: Predicted amidohydrolase n=1 Tax=uncultured Thiotrichaceae bacterium TaxID=298394 RepID=A0A6S6U8D9_9GAMM|nr:MAG: FIG003879: Predicted amidohydrolase [uncultured Thiotrichaceae bacterium]